MWISSDSEVTGENIPQMKESLQTRSYGVDDKSMEEGNEDVIVADGGGCGGWIVRIHNKFTTLVC